MTLDQQVALDEALVPHASRLRTGKIAARKGGQGGDHSILVAKEGDYGAFISCSKAQEYMAKGCQIFLAQISSKKEEDMMEGKQLEDVPVVWITLKSFPRTCRVFLQRDQWNSRST
nr:hypothetical protein [Tanacetum cinerariifolium]